MKNGMLSVVCRKPGELALEERPLPEREAGRGADRHPPHRHLRHRLPHLRRAAPLPSISARHGPRALRRGAGGAEGQRLRRGRPGHRHPLPRLRHLRRLPPRQDELLHDAAMPRRPLRRRHDRALSRCRSRISTRPKGCRSTRRRWSSSWRSARMPCGARGCIPGDRALVVGAGPIGIGTALFARHRRRGGDADGPRAGDPRSRRQHHRLRLHDRSPTSSARERIAALTDGESFDVVFDATGNAAAMEKSFDYAASGGTYVLVGVVKDRHLLLRSGIPPQGADAATPAATPRARTSTRSSRRCARERSRPTGSTRIPARSTSCPQAMPGWAHDRVGVVKAMVRSERHGGDGQLIDSDPSKSYFCFEARSHDRTAESQHLAGAGKARRRRVAPARRFVRLHPRRQCRRGGRLAADRHRARGRRRQGRCAPFRWATRSRRGRSRTARR